MTFNKKETDRYKMLVDQFSSSSVHIPQDIAVAWLERLESNGTTGTAMKAWSTSTGDA
jgi:hypothetical protein